MIAAQASSGLAQRLASVIGTLGVAFIAFALLVWIGDRLGLISIDLPIEVFRIGVAMTLAAFIIQQLGKPRGEKS